MLNDTSNLSPASDDIHVLKKHLLAQQLRLEVSALLENPLSIAALLPPDIPDNSVPNPSSQFPLLFPLFVRLLLHFPPLKEAVDPRSFWTNLGKFLGLLQTVDSGGTSRHLAKRDLLANKAVDIVAAMLGKAIRTTTEEAAKHKEASQSHRMMSTGTAQWTFEHIEIIDSRTTVKRSFWKTSETTEFIIHSRMNGRETVAHRDYSAFKTLHKELIRRPNITVPSLPSAISSPADSAKVAAKIQLTSYLRAISAYPTSTLRDFLNQSEPIAHGEENTQQKAQEVVAALEMFRDELLEPGGMATVIATIGSADEIAELPAHYRSVIDWWKMCGAAAMYRTFIADDRAFENLRRIKTFHARAPYRSWAAILKGTNAVMVVKALGNLLLARPFGRQSLFQSILTGIIDEEIDATMKELKYVESFFAHDPTMVAKAKSIVDIAPLGGYDEEYARELPAEILGYQPPINAPDRQAAEKLLEFYWRLRRMHQLRVAVNEELLVHLAKDILAVSYRPLSEAYKAADPGSFIRDIAKFIDDLLKVVEKEKAKATLSHSTHSPPLYPFMCLLSRHEHRIFKHIRSTLSTQPHRVQALAEIAAWVDDLSQFFRGFGPIVDLAAIVRDSGIDGEALKRDMERLRGRKEDRKRRGWDKVIERVRGRANGDVLDGDLGAKSDDKGLGLQDIWKDDGLGKSDTLQAPTTLHKPRSIQSFESLAPGDEDAAVPVLASEDTEVDTAALEDQLRSLIFDTTGPSSVMEPPDPVTFGASSGFGVVYKRKTVQWKDPVGCETAQNLLDPFMEGLKPWLYAVVE